MSNRLATLVFAILGLVLCAPAARAGDHKDERLGFQIKTPRDWKETPLRKEERWVVANYVCDKKDYYTDGDTNYTRTHTPTLRVVAFVHEVINRPDFEEEEDDDSDESTVRIRLQKVYRDYKEFLRETDSEGHYYDEEETGEVDDVEVDQYVIRKETATGTGNKVMITWIYHLDIADVAVEFEVLEDVYKKRKSTIEKTLRSFKTIERTKGLDLDHMSGDVYISLSDLEEMTPEDRALRRQEQQRLDWQRLVETLPEGWETDEIDGTYVAFHSDIDDKFCKETVDRVQAMMGWMDDVFADIGPGEYVRGPILRICRDREEEIQFRGAGSEGGFVSGTELVTHKDRTGIGAEWTEIVSVGERTLQIWFMDRNQVLYLGMPGWMRVGLGSAFENADVRGRKLRFGVSDFERLLKQECRDMEPMGIRELITMTGKQYRERLNSRDFRPWYQSIVMARFLTERKNREVLSDYMANLRDVLDEIIEDEKAELEKDGGGTKKPENEEEEEKMFKERQERIRAREQRLLEEAFQRTFGDWGDKDWAKFEKAYMKEVD